MPFETADPVKQFSSAQKEMNSKLLQSVEEKVDALAKKVDLLSGYLEASKNEARASYAEVTSGSRVQEPEYVKEQKGGDVSVTKREDSEDDNIRKTEDKYNQADWTVVSQMQKKNVNVIRGKRETSSGSLKGVESRRAYWDIFVGNVKKDSSKEDIEGYLSKNAVQPIHLFLLNSKVKDPISARIRVCLEDKQKVLDPSFWPLYVKVG